MIKTYRELTLEERFRTFEVFIELFGGDVYGSFEEYDSDQEIDNFDFNTDTFLCEG